jgi:uncharacterized protein (TIGR02646 family)
MIWIDRTTTTEPEILKNNNTDPNGEKQRAIKYYESNSGIVVDFQIYGNVDVKKILKELFNHKCAYCESRVAHVSYFHIEHWRPKGGVTGIPQHKGYYWLASEWDNLLLACPECNSQGNKGNRFPLVAGSTYAYNSKDDYKLLEKPLLINPCETDPKSHFSYTLMGAIQGVTDEGKMSVEVYGLDRDLITVERMAWAKVVKRCLNEILYAISDALREPKREAEYKARIDEQVVDLQEYVSSNFHYSAMNRYIIEDYKRTHHGNVVFQEIMDDLLKV